MLTHVHIALLTELGRIGNVEFYEYLVPNGTEARALPHIGRRSRYASIASP